MRIHLIGGNTIIGNENESLVRLGVELGAQSYLLRKKRLQFIIPFRVETAITAATKEGYGQRFYQTAFSGGFGGIIAMRPTDFFSIYTEATKWYGFSNSAGNFFGGNTDQFKTKTTIHFNSLLRGRAIEHGQTQGSAPPQTSNENGFLSTQWQKGLCKGESNPSVYNYTF